MHDTARIAGGLFAATYGKEGARVLDVGGCNTGWPDVNGSLRVAFESKNMTYVCLDIEPHPSVDVVMKPGDVFPFPDESFDLIVSTSCFEHDPCFWMTFREMCRLIKKDGFIYINAPSNGPYHQYPGDNWRFYSDAGQALAYWSGRTINGTSHPVTLVETFHIRPLSDVWIDFVGIWKRTDNPETSILLSREVRQQSGPLQTALHAHGVSVMPRT
jgi:SAM-dependent methyltransferase